MITRSQQFFEALYAGQSGVLELRTVPLADRSEERGIAAQFRDFVPVTNGTVDMTRVNRFLARTASRRMAAYFRRGPAHAGGRDRPKGRRPGRACTGQGARLSAEKRPPGDSLTCMPPACP